MQDYPLQYGYAVFGGIGEPGGVKTIGSPLDSAVKPVNNISTAFPQSRLPAGLYVTERMVERPVEKTVVLSEEIGT